MYCEPPPAALQQGCIVRELYFDAQDTQYWAVTLTPACDFAQEKAQYALFVALLPFDEFLGLVAVADGAWQDAVPKIAGSPNSGNRRVLTKKLRELIGGQDQRYHWFDRYGDYGPWVADFQLVACVPQQDFEQLDIVTALDAKHLESLPARWSAYMGRIGVPDRDPGHLDEIVTLAASTVFGDGTEFEVPPTK